MHDDLIEGRLNDIPYRTSPPLLFVYTNTASLIAGKYTYDVGIKTAFTPSRPINPNSLYIFKTMDFAADVAVEDYLGAITTALNFSMYVQSDAGGPALREPIPLVKYLQTIPYVLNILGTEMLGQAYPGNAAVTPTQGFEYNRLLGAIGGVLTQTAPLLGKGTLTLTVVFSVQEITDRNFISDFVARSEAPGVIFK
jgi:hypothetical protein